MKTVGRHFREQLVEHVQSGIKDHENVFLLNYSNVSSIQFSEFRKSLKKIGADVFVSRKALVELALKNNEQKELAEKINGQTALVWSNSDSVEISKILVKFAKGCEQAALPGGIMSGRLIDEADIKTLSDLPSREVLLAHLLGTISAPITRLLGAFNAKSRDLLSILNQLSEKKGGSENG